jgi:hypothetical protein
VPPPLNELASISPLKDAAVREEITWGDRKASRQFALYDLLRHEQVLAAGDRVTGRSEAARSLDFVQMAYGDLVGVLTGREDGLLDSARDGEWTLRDLLRHAIAVEIRYASQIEWSASRRDDQPIAIPPERLPCDRLVPPAEGYADAETAGITRVLELLGHARRGTDRLLAGLPDAALERASMWGTVQMTVRMRLHQAAAHLTEVALQAEKMLRDDPDSEARRILRHCVAMRGFHERWSDADARTRLDARYLALAGAANAAS